MIKFPTDRAAEPERDAVTEAIGRTVVAVVATPFVLAAALVLWLPLTVYTAFVARHYWAWFVQPAFGPPAPSLVALTGVLLLVRLVQAKPQKRADTPEEKTLKYNTFHLWAVSALFISVFWLIGYGVHLFDA